MKKQEELRNRIAYWFSCYDQMLRLGHEAEVKRELQDEDDLFLFLCFSEWLGVPNPVTYHTLELYPLILEEFHQWHQRMGMDRSPLEYIRCC
jgi:hypothetical protein